MQAGPTRALYFMEEDAAGLLLQAGGTLFNADQRIVVNMQAQGGHVPMPTVRLLQGRDAIVRRAGYAAEPPGVTLTRNPRPAKENKGTFWVWPMIDLEDGAHEIVYHVFGGDERDVNSTATWRECQVYIEIEHGCLRRLFFHRSDAEDFATRGIRERQARDAQRRGQ